MKKRALPFFPLAPVAVAIAVAVSSAAPLAAPLSVVVSVVAAAAPAAAPATPAAAPATAASEASAGIQRAAWLTGCWEQVANGRTVEEHWLAPRGKNMMQIGRTMRGDALVEYELVVVREEGDRLAYEAHPSGQPSAVFLSKNIGPTSIVFENLEHDFPQRVGYDRTGDALTGWIEGTKDGKTRRIEFPYTRVPCAGK